MKMIEWMLRYLGLTTTTLVIIAIALGIGATILLTHIASCDSVITMTELIMGYLINCAIFGGLIALAVCLVDCIEERYELRCEDCGDKKRDTKKKFCNYCGGKVVAKKIFAYKCKNGHAIKGSDSFCPKCGVRVGE